MVKADRTDSAAWCRDQARELIRSSVLLEREARNEAAKVKLEAARLKQAPLSEAKLLALDG